jgi:hypothetical protein
VNDGLRGLRQALIVPGEEKLQGVVCYRVSGFDDLWEKKLDVPDNVTLSCLVLRPPDKIRWWYQAGPSSGTSRPKTSGFAE